VENHKISLGENDYTVNVQVIRVAVRSKTTRFDPFERTLWYPGRKASPMADRVIAAFKTQSQYPHVCPIHGTRYRDACGACVEGEDEMTDAQIKHMVDRFLGWKLPADFRPDGGIEFTPDFNVFSAHPQKREPSGTNLFDARQADAMVRYMVEGMPPNAPEERP